MNRPNRGLGTDNLAQTVRIPTGDTFLSGEWGIPAGSEGIVLFAHGSGSSRHSPRNRYVAGIIRDAGIGTLLFDLLTHKEEDLDLATRHFRFNIGLLATRLADATGWVAQHRDTAQLRVGYFGASTGAAAALVAAAALGEKIGAVVSRGGRPDLAGDSLARVAAPTLLIVGERDSAVMGLNEQAYGRLRCAKELKIVPNATHLFEEAGALERVAQLAADWFARYLRPGSQAQ